MTGDDPVVEETAAGGPAASHRRPSHTVLAGLADQFPSASFTEDPGQDQVELTGDELLSFVQAAHQAGYDMFIDLAGVDYLRRRPRFEVVVNLVSRVHRHRLRIRAGVDGTDPKLPSITSVYAGANFYERETYDLYGIVFEGHPDLTRILLPDDWEGHPLRKDYPVGSVPVQFKEAHKAS